MRAEEPEPVSTDSATITIPKQDPTFNPLSAIMQLVNHRTGQTFTRGEAERILRADFKRRLREAKRMELWRKQQGATS